MYIYSYILRWWEKRLPSFLIDVCHVMGVDVCIAMKTNCKSMLCFCLRDGYNSVQGLVVIINLKLLCFAFHRL